LIGPQCFRYGALKEASPVWHEAAVDPSTLWRSDDPDRATHRSSDQTSFPAAGQRCLICPNLFVAGYRLPPRSDYYHCARPALAKQITAVSTASMPRPALTSPVSNTDSFVKTGHGHSICPPALHLHNADSRNIAFKTHNAFVPNRRGFLQRAVSKAPRTDQRSTLRLLHRRSASDTVLNVLVSGSLSGDGPFHFHCSRTQEYRYPEAGAPLP
jgi:hypothetical protein